jgi:dTDP-glucose 4,6-dehydratase
METILVTGGAGFIGSNFIKYIYNKYVNYRIIVLDSLTYAGSVNNFPADAFDSDRFEFWYGNILNADLVDVLVQKSDYVIHFAAESHVTRSIYDNRLFFETDVLGTQVIANSVLRYKDKIKLLMHISTSEVYGTAMTASMDEFHPLNPMSPYAAAKCGADRLVYSYWQTYKIPCVIIRPFNNYGAFQHLEKVIPRFITSCILDQPITIHGDGSAMRDFLYVEDHCKALDLILHNHSEKIYGGVLNLGADKAISVLEIAEIIKKEFNKSDIKINFIGDRPGQVFRHTCNSSKIYELFGWQSETNFVDGIRKTINWYQLNESWWEPQKWMRHIPIINAENKKEFH